MATWAKAPDFADRPERREQVRAQTVVDKQRYLEEGLTPIACRNCGTEALVRKASNQQKSVQWTVNPADHCPVFKSLVGGPGKPDSCPSLDEAIERAVEDGQLPIQQ